MKKRKYSKSILKIKVSQTRGKQGFNNPILLQVRIAPKKNFKFNLVFFALLQNRVLHKTSKTIKNYFKEVSFDLQQSFKKEFLNPAKQLISKFIFYFKTSLLFIKNFKPTLDQKIIFAILFITVSIWSGNSLILQHKKQIIESKTIKSVAIKQVSPIIVGQPVHYTVLIKRDSIQSKQYLAKLPKEATHIKIKIINKKEAEQILSQKMALPQDSLTLQKRQQLVSAVTKLKNPNSRYNNIIGIFSNIKRFFLASLAVVSAETEETLITDTAPVPAPVETPVTVPETLIEEMLIPEETLTTDTTPVPEEAPVTVPETPTSEVIIAEVIQTKDANFVDLSDQAIVEPSFAPPSLETSDGQSKTTEGQSKQEEPISGVDDVVSDITQPSPLETVSPSDQPIVESNTQNLTPNTDYVQIDYQMPAPQITEQDTNKGKIVTVSSLTPTSGVDDTAPGIATSTYTNVLAFTNIPEIFKVGQESKIQIKWQNNNNEEMPFTAYDVNQNGKIDYIEWIVPHLSEQKFNIIFISKAFQLDENRDIVDDIYEAVSIRDDKYATIANGQYVRSTFDQPLTNQNNITIYAKSTPGVDLPDVIATIEVYTENGTELIASFDNIKDEGFYKVALTNLQTPIDAFDLKIIGNIAIDYIVSADFDYSPNKILTPSGYKNISQLKIGDEVIGYDNNTQVTNKIENIQFIKPNAYDHFEQDENGNNTENFIKVPFVYYLINEKWELYKNQSLWANNRVVHASELQVGDIIYDTTRQPIEITSIRSGEDHIQWMTLTVSGNHSYVADDLLLHNASRYWVGGGASVNWNATGNTNWSATSGGSNNADVPTSVDDVFFDGAGTGASNSTLSADITIRSLNMTGYANTLTHNSAIDLSIGDATAGASNIALVLAGTYTLGSATTSAIQFVSTSTTVQTVNFAGKTSGRVTYNGVGGSWQLTGTHNAGNSTSVTLTNGTLNTNGQTAAWGSFNSNNSNTRVLTLGASAITLAQGSATTSWNLTTATNLTFTANTASITLSGNSVTFAGGAQTYGGTVSLTGASSVSISGINTFVNLTRTGTSTKTNELELNANQTVTGTLTLAGNSAINRLLVQSNAINTTRTITNTGATMTWSNVDFQDITLGTAFDASAITGLSGDAGGNSGITFTTAANQYMKTAVSVNWSASNWFTTSGGSTAGRVPLPQDTAIFDALSITAGSVTITQDMPRIGSVDFTGVTNTPTWTTSTATSVFGSITLVSGMTLTASTQAYIFEGRSTFTLTNAGLTWAKDITLDAPNGTLTLQDAFAAGATNTFTLTSGTFNANNFNFTVGNFNSSGSTTRVITMGTGTWTLTGNAGTIWTTATSTNLTLNDGNAIVSNYSGATGTRTITVANTESVAPSFNVTAGTDTVTVGTAAESLNFTGFAGTFTNSTRTLYGSLTVVSGMTVATGGLTTTFAATSGTKSITTNGVTLDITIVFDGVGGTFQLADALIVTRSVTLTNGTFNANNFNFTAVSFSSSNSNTRVITMGSGTWELTGTGTVWTTATTTGLTLNANTSTIKITDASANSLSFSGGGLTYNNIWWSRGIASGSNTIIGSNTFADFKDDGSVAHSILFTAGITTTVTTWTVSGTLTNEIIINSTTTATHALVKAGGGVISSNYLDIQHSVATPSSTWYAGENSFNNQSVATAGSGWTFTNPTVCASLATGNWNTAGTWDCGHVPTTADTVTVTAGHTVTMNVDSAVLGAITVNGTLNTTDGTSRALSGTTLTIGSAGTLTANASTITLSGTTGTLITVTAGGVFTAGTSTVVFSGNGDATLSSGTINFNSVTSSGTGTKTLGAALDLEGTLTISAGTLDISGSNFGITAKSWTDTGSGTFTEGTGTVTFDVAGGTINSNETFENVTINHAGTTTLGAALDLDDTLTITGGALDVSGTNYGITLKSWTDTGAGTFTEGTGTVTFDVAGGTINSNETFENVTINHAGTTTLGAALDLDDTLTITGGALDVSGTNYGITLKSWTDTGAGTFTEGTGTVTFDVTGGTINSNEAFENVTINHAGTTTLGADFNLDDTLTITGGALDVSATNYGISLKSWTDTGAGTFTEGTGTVTFSMGGTINSNETFNNVTISNLVVTTTLGAALDLEGTLTIVGGTLDVSANNYGITLKSWTDTLTTAGFTERTGTVTFDVAGGTINSDEAFENVTINHAGTTTLGAALYLDDTLTITGGALDVSGTNYGITLKSWTDTGAGTFTEGTGTVTFDVTGGTINSNEAFNNVTINHAGTSTLGADTTIASVLTISSGTLSASTYTITLSGTGTVFSNSGTYTAGTSTISITDTSSTSKTFAGGGGTFNALSITGAGTGAVIISGSNTFSNFTISPPKTVTFTSSTTQTITGTFSCTGTSGNVITINSSTSGTAATLSKSSGTVSCDYLSLKDSAGTGGATWSPGSNSTNVSGNSGWVFDATAPTTTATATVGGSSYTFGNWANGNATVTLTCADNAGGTGCSTTKYCTDTTNTCTPTTTYSTTITISDETTSYIRYYSTDTIPNTETTASSTVKIDKTNPTVSAGSDQTKSASFTQDATASDAGSGIASYLWSKVSGSGSITFGTGTAEDTTVSASANDTYVIRLTITDNANNSASDDFTLVWSAASSSGGEGGSVSGGTPISYVAAIEQIIKIPEKIVEQIKEIPNNIVEQSQKVVEQIIQVPKQLIKLITPIKEKPIEVVTVPEETPLALQGKWDFLFRKQIRELLFSPLPTEIKSLAAKLPEIKKTFNETGIATVNATVQKLQGIELVVPGLGKRILSQEISAGKIVDTKNLQSVELTVPEINQEALSKTDFESVQFALPKNIPMDQLSVKIKKTIPTEIVFARTANELIDFNIVVSLNSQGEIQQRINTISGTELKLAVKPDGPVDGVKGYIILKTVKQEQNAFQMSLKFLTASLMFSNPNLVALSEGPPKVEKSLLLQEFDYEDLDKDGIYSATVKAPMVDGEYEVITIMNYKDIKVGDKEIRLIVVIDPEGYVYNNTMGGELRINGAIVSLYWLNPKIKKYELWPADQYQQVNPQITDKTGKYAFLTPEGLYYLEVTAPNYSNFRSEVFTVKESSGVHMNIELKGKNWWMGLFDWKIISVILIFILLFYLIISGKIRINQR